MGKSLLSTATKFAKNVGKHAKRIVYGVETPGEAWVRVSKDAHKLKRAVEKKVQPATQREARDLVSQGRRAYNEKDYDKAEKFFRTAIMTDHNCCPAHTYLGHTLYKLGRLSEAEGAWRRALDVAPTEAAAEVARKKLLHLQKKKQATVENLEDRLRRGE